MKDKRGAVFPSSFLLHPSSLFCHASPSSRTNRVEATLRDHFAHTPRRRQPRLVARALLVAARARQGGRGHHARRRAPPLRHTHPRGVARPPPAALHIGPSAIPRPGLVDLEKQLVVNIDHHSTTALFGDINWIDSTASAVGEMIYNLCKALGVRVTKEIAECVYTALITDTGSFHYSNTSERTFKVASELVRAGVKPAKVSQAVFANYPWSKIELMSEVLSTVRREAPGRVAWLVQTLDMQERTGASDEDGDGFVNYPMSCGDVEACAFFKETAPGVYRVSLRSKCDVNVARIAERFRGGGHRNAAGCTFNGTWDEAEREVVGQLVYAVEHRGENGTGALQLPPQQELVAAPEGRKHERDVRP